MRPLLLTLHSFGPYGGSESVDFTALSQRGLFLITGNTGAGKTTIFDAIVFALYGKASGSGRETEFFRSDYASPDSVCSVDFTFAIGEQQYSVSRRPRQTRRSLRKNGQEVKVPAAASLSLPDGTLLTNINQVDEKLQELLGLTESQFKQIVLLPQGEFRKLLEAKNEEKQIIFRKIFETDFYHRFAVTLSDQEKQLQQQISAYRQKADALLHSFPFTQQEQIAVANESTRFPFLRQRSRELETQCQEISRQLNRLEKDLKNCVE